MTARSARLIASAAVLQPLLPGRVSISDYGAESTPSHSESFKEYTRHLSCQTSRILRSLLPSFAVQREKDAAPQRNRNKHLDGLRGIACLIVCVYHSIVFYVPGVEYAYGANGRNYSPLQFPIIRLLYTGSPMVYIFFVLSGYVLSRKPLRLSRQHASQEVLSTLSSSCFRRWIRLFLPCIVVYMFVGIQIQLGMFQWSRYKNIEPINADIPPFRSLSEGMKAVAADFLRFSDVFGWKKYWSGIAKPPLMSLWTIPTEFRCSIIVFVLVLALWNVKPIWRSGVFIPFLSVYSLLMARPDVSAFCAGMVLAELSVIREETAPVFLDLHTTQTYLDNGIAAGGFVALKPSTWKNMLIRLNVVRQLGLVIVMLLGLYLLSFPYCGASSTPGFRLLLWITPSTYSFKDDWWAVDPVVGEFWYAVGATLLVLVVEHMPCIQRLLSTAVVQYFGRISFSLYLMHALILLSLGDYLLAALTGNPTEVDVTGHKYLVAVFGSSLLCLPVIIYAADLTWRFVDEPSVQLARQLERFVRAPNAR